jgi:nitrite reductase/ring-hydroxylating ferredoxin subunit
MENKKMNEFNKRREFLITTGKVAGFGLFAGAFSSIITSCEQDELPPKPPPGANIVVDINSHPEILASGTYKIFSDPKLQLNAGSPVIIKHLENDVFFVMDGVCRHNGGNVDIRTPSNDMICNLHSAIFSFEDGKVLDNKSFNVPDMKIFETEYNAANKLLTIFLG